MKTAYRLNGRQVTKRQWDAHFRKRKAMFGDPCERMLAEQAPPSVRTNDSFMRGKKDQNCDQGLDADMLASHREKARRSGVSLEGKHWFGTLASDPLDLEAWCGSDSEVIAKARKEKILVELNGNVHDFREKYRDVPDDTPYRVDDTLVENQTAIHAEQLGAITPAERKQLKEDLRREMTPANL